MGDIDWFCNFMGCNLHWYQKIILKVHCGEEIRRMRNIMKYMTDEYRESSIEIYRTYELDLDKINSVEDCKKILNFLCKHTLKPHPIGWEYKGFEDVEEYFK